MAEYELWYKNPSQNGGSAYALGSSDPDLSNTHVSVSSERPGAQSRNGYHLVVRQTDLPKLSVSRAAAPVLTVPTTLQEIGSCLYPTSMRHLEKAVGQLLVAGYVGNVRCQLLLQRLTELAQGFDKLHQGLLGIPAESLRLADERAAEKK